MLHKRIQSQEEKKIEVQLPISDHQPLVNLFRQSDKFSIEDSSRSPESADTTKSSRDSPNLDSSGFNPKLASKQDVSQKADPSTLVAKA